MQKIRRNNVKYYIGGKQEYLQGVINEIMFG